MTNDNNETTLYTATEGPVAHVDTTDEGRVKLIMTLHPERPWFAVPPKTARRIAWLMFKYSIIAMFKGKTDADHQ